MRKLTPGCPVSVLLTTGSPPRHCWCSRCLSRLRPDLGGEVKPVEPGHLVPQRVVEMKESQARHTSRLLFRETGSRLKKQIRGEL